MPRDALVLGAGIGGLSAAIHLRLRGFDVKVIEQRSKAGGKAAQILVGGYKFDPGPSIVILTRIYEEVFKSAGKRMEDYLQFDRLDPFTTIYQEGKAQPIDLSADESQLFATLKEIAPEDYENFWRLMQGLESVVPGVEDAIFGRPINQPWDMIHPGLMKFAKVVSVRKSAKSEIDRLFQSPLLRAFFYGFPSYSGQSYHSPSPGAFMIPYFMVREGVFWPRGGISAIPTALFNLASDLGVEFEFGQKVTSIMQFDKRISRIQTENGSHEAGVVISNMDRTITRRMLGDQLSPKPSYSYFTVHLGVRRKYPDLKIHNLFIPNGFEQGFEQLYSQKQIPNPPIVYINETSNHDPSTAPEGCSNLFAVFTVPAIEPHLDWKATESTAVEHLITELAKYGIIVDPTEIEVTRVQTPITFEERDGNYRGSLYGPDEAQRLWGFMPQRCRDEKVKNLFYAGGSVQPGAGMPMVTLSGKFAAELAAKAAV
ncbi:MAG: phytoene desaturase [Armatimonadetes bacterium]|nr:phytoene desaturase [Armatimonadota bacterium]